jgi:hypothetical protein
MNTKTKVIKRQIALNSSRITVLQLIANARHYVQSMTGNPHFSAPVIPLPDVSAAASTLESTYALTLTRVKGAVAQKNEAKSALHLKLKALAAYVESIANADPEHAESILTSSGMQEKKIRSSVPHVFDVKLTQKPGEAMLSTKGVKHGCYIYEMTTDPNLAAASWTVIYQGVTMKFLKTGLPSSVKHFFRCSTIDKNGHSAWSSVLSVVIQ